MADHMQEIIEDAYYGYKERPGRVFKITDYQSEAGVILSLFVFLFENGIIIRNLFV